MKPEILLKKLCILPLMFMLSGCSDSKTTEIDLFGCIWSIPNTMSITKNENPKRINIVTKDSSKPLKTIIVSYKKKDQEGFLKPMKVKKIKIGKHNNYFKVFSLSSEIPVINELKLVLYENEEAFGMVSNFTEEERLTITEKCF